MTNSTILRSRLTLATATLVLGALSTACGERADDPKTLHAVDGDTGAAAPATRRNMSATPGVPDSTPGVAQPTGTGLPAGDTLSAKQVGKTKKP
jgi:hypothetical protein